MRRIIYTRHDGGVSLHTPTREIFKVMSNGGYWDAMPVGFVNRQIAGQIADGIHWRHARRFALAVAYGGCTTAEVWEICKDRDCARFGTGHDLIDDRELPDTWFRNAWVRSPNGVPVRVDLEKAREIQWQAVTDAVEREAQRRSRLLRAMPPQSEQWRDLREPILRAPDEVSLRHCWPAHLPNPGVQACVSH